MHTKNKTEYDTCVQKAQTGIQAYLILEVKKILYYMI